jgi:two-component system response regulator MprA
MATVLIVDDDAEVIRTFGSCLQLEGYTIRTATDGERALNETAGADAVILDVRMPTLDGLGFLRRLRSRGDSMPVLVVTGAYLLDDAEVREFDRLDAEIVFKPLWLDELVSLTNQLVTRVRTA